MNKPHIIDTNLLVLLVVGATSEEYIYKHKRTRNYTAEEFQLLKIILSAAEKLIVTPNVLSETSNLLRQFREPGASQIMETFRSIISINTEIYVESAMAAQRSEFSYLGLTDASLLEIKPEDLILVTDDFDLYQASSSTGRPTISFSHEREKWLRV